MLQEQPSWEINPEYLKAEADRMRDQSGSQGRGKLDNAWGRFTPGDNYIRFLPWSQRGVIAKYLARHKHMPFPGQVEEGSHVCPSKSFSELGLECPICKVIATIEPFTEEASNYYPQHQYWTNVLFYDIDKNTNTLVLRAKTPFILRLTKGVYDQLIKKITTNPLCKRTMHPTMGVIYCVNMPPNFEGKNTYTLEIFYPNHSIGATEAEITEILGHMHNLDEIFRPPDSTILQTMYQSAQLLQEKYKSVMIGTSSLSMSPPISAPVAPPDPRVIPPGGGGIPLNPPTPPPPPPPPIPVVQPPSLPQAPSPVASPPAAAAFKCPNCERSFPTRQGMSKHNTMSHVAPKEVSIAVPPPSAAVALPQVPPAQPPSAQPLAGVPDCFGTYSKTKATPEGKRKCWLCKMTLPCTKRENGT